MSVNTNYPELKMFDFQLNPNLTIPVLVTHNHDVWLEFPLQGDSAMKVAEIFKRWRENFEICSDFDKSYVYKTLWLPESIRTC